MKIDLRASEIVNLFKEIHARSEQLFDLMRSDIRQCGGPYGR